MSEENLEITGSAVVESKPPVMRVRVDLDGTVIAELSIDKQADDDTNARVLAPMLSHAGSEAVWKMHGEKAAQVFGHYMFSMAPPTPERLQYERLYVLLGDIVNGKVDPRGWAWHTRRLDNAIVLTKVDDDGNVVDTLTSPGHGQAYVDLVRANYHMGEDNLRVLGGMFAAYGIPYGPHNDASAAPLEGVIHGLPGGAALGQRAVLLAARSLMNASEGYYNDQCAGVLSAQAQADATVDAEDTAPREAKALASYLRLHPYRARRLIAALRSNTPDKTALLADALEADVNRTFHVRDTISLAGPRPTLLASAADADDDASKKNVRRDYENSLASWRRLYGKVGPKRSNNLVRRAIAAMRYNWDADSDDDGDAKYEAFQKRFDMHSTEELIRLAVRPWEGSKKFVEVGNVKFGKLPKQQHPDWPELRRSDTPRDFYRLLYLFRPTGINFTDMYGGSVCSMLSPCGRFGMSFYWHSYELAAYQYVVKELAVRTREERGPFRIQSGIPGVDNGVASLDKDARRWFKMISMALGREWCVYGGNNFNV